MKLKDIIQAFNYLCDVRIIQTDSYLETSPNYGEADEIYTGTVWDIPWWIVEMYLDMDDGEGSVFLNEKEKTIDIYVREELTDDKEKVDK